MFEANVKKENFQYGLVTENDIVNINNDILQYLIFKWDGPMELMQLLKLGFMLYKDQDCPEGHFKIKKPEGFKVPAQ